MKKKTGLLADSLGLFGNSTPKTPKTSNVFRPPRYFESIDDPEYSRARDAYIHEYLFERHIRQARKNPLKLKNLRDVNYKSLEDSLKLIEAGWSRGEFKADSDQYLIEALGLFSHISFVFGRLSRIEPAERLGAAVCFALGSLLFNVRWGDFTERTSALKRVNRIFAALVPDTRGKKRNTAHGYLVEQFYYQELFRFQHIEHTLKTAPGTPRNKIKIASEKFQVPVEQIKKFFGLDEDYHPDMALPRLDSAKQMALIGTAKHFKMTPGTVSNLLSRTLELSI